MNFNSELWSTVLAVVLGVISVAALAVFLSPKGQTANIISAAATGLQGSLGAAEAPVLGASYSFPTQSSGLSEF